MNKIKLVLFICCVFMLASSECLANEAQVRQGANNAEESKEKPKSKKEIKAKTAGQTLRQPQEETKWLETLAKNPQTPLPQIANPTNTQEKLVQTYVEDIWAKLSQEFKLANKTINRDELNQFIEINKEIDTYEDTHFYLFISESVPMTTLKNYLTALQKVNVVYVLQGVIGDDVSKFMPTQIWTQRVLCKLSDKEEVKDCAKGPVDINPNLFRLLGITQVPALVYIANPKEFLLCNNQEQLADLDGLIWYGDIEPAYILQRFMEIRPEDKILVELFSLIQAKNWSELGVEP